MRFILIQTALILAAAGGQLAWCATVDDSAAQQTSLPTSVTVQKSQTLKITVYREPDLSGTFEVDDSGTISFPLVGNVLVAGKSIETIREDIATALKKFVINPQISISLEVRKSETGSSQDAVSSITVLGEVRSPGTYESSGSLTLTKLLAMAGGSTPVADMKKVKMVRAINGEQKVFVYDIEDINNAKVKDPVLLPGDKIVVPQEEKDVNTVAILGEVKMAGIYEVTPGFTLMRVIAKAGGFTPLASTGKVRLVRQENGQKKIYVFNASAIINGDTDDPEVRPGDMIFIPESFF